MQRALLEKYTGKRNVCEYMEDIMFVDMIRCFFLEIILPAKNLTRTHAWLYGCLVVKVRKVKKLKCYQEDQVCIVIGLLGSSPSEQNTS